MINTTYRKSFPKNPFTDWLNHAEIKPGDFSIMARVENAGVYDAMEGHKRVLPQSFVQAIEELEGKGAGKAVALAYLDYREGCRTILMKQPAEIKK